MPIRKNAKKRSTKYRARPRRRAVRRNARTPQNYSLAPSGMPMVRTARMRVVHRFSMEISNALTAFTVIANGPQAPIGAALTGTSVIDEHQPMGFDQWQQLYNHYIVKGARCRVEFNGPPTSDDPVLASSVGIYLSDNAAPSYTRPTTYREAKKGQVRSVQTRSRTPTIVTGYYSPRKFFGIKDIKDNYQLGASVDAIPGQANQAIWVIWGCAEDREIPTEAYTTYGNVTVDYIIEFREPKDLARSV